MTGRRLPDADKVQTDDMQPGDYVKWTGADPMLVVRDGEQQWIVRLPNGHVGRLHSRNHTFTVHEDGSLTLSPSILFTAIERPTKPPIPGWHGYLERGVWREC